MWIGTLLNVYESIIDGSVHAVNWLFTPLDVIHIAPVMLLSAGGLLAYLVIAIVKWVIS